MWRCSNCSESVEDAFDACWNCGAARDGTVDADFEREPDDPAVPDPGAEAAAQRDQADADLTTAGGGLNRREIAALVCKTLALILFALVAVSSLTAVLPLALMFLSAPYEWSHEFLLLLCVAVPLFAMFVVGVIYWKKSNLIAKFMLSADPSPVTIQSFTVQDAMIVVLSTVGLCCFLEGIVRFVGIVYFAQNFTLTASEFWNHPQIWSATVQLASGLWLMFGSRGIVGVIHWCRTAGVPRGGG